MLNNSEQPQLQFVAEIKRTSQRKSASLDNTFQLVLETSDQNILDLGKLPPDIVVKVTVERISEADYNG